LARALSNHQVIQEGKGASKRPTVEAFTQDVPHGSGAVRAGLRNAFHCLVNALIRDGYMEEQHVGVVLRLFVQPDAGVADGKLRNEICGLDGEEIKDGPLSLFKVHGRAHD
jgi:hypothetical protein